MSASTDPSTSPAAAWLARGISATWWYTAGSVVFIYVTVVGIWGLTAIAASPVWPRPVTAIAYLAGVALTLAGTLLLLGFYRRGVRAVDAPRAWPPAPLHAAAFAGMLAGAALMAVSASSIVLGVGITAYALLLLRWPAGVRLRLTLLSAAVLCVLWAVEGEHLAHQLTSEVVFVLPSVVIMLGPATALSLWWWDIVVELNRARAAESRLAAVQERLRLAGDLHDLQGHHLQVIALQLELAERMLPRDPAAAAEQVRLARASVDDARRGTRELAGRFRGVPLPDELANAADLLRAAGLRVDLDIAPDAAEAPVDVLGPVIRECTTNVLKHGGGKWARLSLRYADGAWVLRVANDAGTAISTLGAGAGLAGIADRVQSVGGDLESGADGDAFDVTVTVPAVVAGAREERTR